MTLYLRDRSSGRIHVGVKLKTTILTSEACNLDDAGEREEIGLDEAMQADAGKLCKRCIPGDVVALVAEPESDRLTL